MEKREPYSLESPLIWWNLSLSIFSMWGFARLTPEWLWSWSENSFDYSICVASFVEGVTGFWCELFAMSKVLELLDTVFLILRKKPLVFLHWYHHCTVIIYTWYGYKDHMASARWCIWMNYGIHCIMYGYYAIRALKIRVPKRLAMTITALQTLQMFIGVFIVFRIYYIKSMGGECQQTDENMYFTIGIYITYFLLFVNFFYSTYMMRNNKFEKEDNEKEIMSPSPAPQASNLVTVPNPKLRKRPTKI